MKNLVKIILLLMLPVFASAQSGQKQLDSLQVTLKNAANDTIRMEVYYQLGVYYNEINRDSSLFYLNKSIPLAQKLKLKINEAKVLSVKGYMLTQIGNYPRSLETFLQALKIAEDPASEKYTWNLPKGKTPQNARLNALGWIYHIMGHLYGATGNTDKQISNYFTAISLAESVQDTVLFALANMNIGRVYFRVNKLDSALIFAQRALDVLSTLSFEQRKYEGATLNVIGNIYQEKGNLNQAVDAYMKAVQANTEHNNFTNLEFTYTSLGGLYITLKKPDSAMVYALKALKTAKSVGQPLGLADAYGFLSKVYSYQNNKDSAFAYLKLATTLKDSLNNVEKKNLLAYQNVGFDEQLRLQKLEEEKIQMQSKIRTNTLAGSLFTLLVIAFFLYRNNRQKQKAKQNIEKAYDQLKSTQSQLIQSEKMASLGELTAGIAHEIQNPLNFVNNFSEVSNELIDEMNDELDKGDIEEAKAISKDIKENGQKINHHGKRADAIVKGMLQHSRTSTGQKELTDINALADEYLRLSYHGLRAKDKSFNADFKTEFDESLPKINVIPQDIGRVLLNLINNAFYAVSEARSPKPEAGSNDYKPEVIVSTKKSADKIEISVHDNGPGIPSAIVDKIFQPFFTTKPTGQGTGLGLSLSYDIVKAHGGEISVESNPKNGTIFIINLPINQ